MVYISYPLVLLYPMSYHLLLFVGVSQACSIVLQYYPICWIGYPYCLVFLYVVYHSKRDLIIKKLKEHKIQININYPFPIHKMKAYKNMVCNKCDCLPITEKIGKTIITLPTSPNLKKSQIEFIIESINRLI